MKAFTIRVNGSKAATIGFGDNGVLDTSVVWTGGVGEELEFILMMSGLDSSVGEDGEHLRWKSRRLMVGDEVMIRLEDLSADRIDPPTQREPVKRERARKKREKGSEA